MSGDHQIYIHFGFLEYYTTTNSYTLSSYARDSINPFMPLYQASFEKLRDTFIVIQCCDLRYIFAMLVLYPAQYLDLYTYIDLV